ncbi:response regulator [Flavobacteriaceae bacterium XHP0103]|uniref:hybrid sensor histidine kinase/response regulator transcription factor n=1 Tax=Marixanthotalea marina TaxID=2844359 RepID=UPI00298A036B|nr:two-component regulator propeller domain-containing protein [Marixanthotalea marina]MBU3821399.1 response regulator [Marixanthotalea marina]
MCIKNKKYVGFVILFVIAQTWFTAIAQSHKASFVPIGERTLSNSYARSFLKDSKGYVWIGTSDGLVKYDGFKVNRYEHNPKDINSIIDNNVNVIVEDANQQLWVGTAKGISKYDREKDRFININELPENKNHLNNIYITSLAFDANGNLWIGTHGGGLNIYDPLNNIFYYISGYNVHSSPLSENYITDLLFANDLIWCATMDGLQVYNYSDKSIETLKLKGDSLPKKQITRLNKDSKGNVAFSTFEGDILGLESHKDYYTIERKFSSKAVKDINLSNILTFSEDSKANLWIVGDNSGLHYLDKKTGEISYFGVENNYLEKLPTNSIRSIYIDDNGLVWVGTFNKGVYLTDNNSNRFESYGLGDFKLGDLEGKDVRAFAEDKQGNIWIGCDGIGIIKLDVKTQELKRYDEVNRKFETKVVTALLFSKDNTLWVGMDNEGAFKINLKNNSIEKFKVESGGFGDNKINLFYEDSNGTIWCGTNGSGLFYFDNKKQGFVKLFENDKPLYITKNAYVSDVLEDSENNLWVSTFYGLFKLKALGNNTYSYQIYGKDISIADVYGKDILKEDEIFMGTLNGNSIQAIYEDADKNLWIGSSDSGLNIKMHQTNEFKSYQKVDGLVSNTVKSIVADEKEDIWISTNMGLSKFNKQTNEFTLYDNSDGLKSSNFNYAALLGSNGKLFFGSNNGFSAFYPDSIQRKKSKPLVYLTDLRINNKSVEVGVSGSPLDKHISLASNLELEYNQRSFALDYIGVKYGQSSGYNYCYKLEGFDDDWNCIGGRLSATYTNVDPGHYTFLVRASNRDGILGETQRLGITVHPLLWKTWWAILIYVVFASAVVFFLISLRLERVKIKNQLDIERLAREQEKELSELKTQFFTNISHEFRTPLSLMAMPLESLSSVKNLPNFIRDRVKMIRTSSDKMMRLVNELMDFSKLESTQLKLYVQKGELVKFIANISSIFKDVALKRNIHFDIHSQVDSLPGWFDHDKLEKILVNLLSNAFKFTSDKGQINIIIDSKVTSLGPYEEVQCLELSVVDNGIGIPKEELPFIFDKFYQAKSASTVVNVGTGIGLSLTKGLVELHKGDIKVESKPNHETVFVILLPIEKMMYSEEDICKAPDCIDTAAAISENGIEYSVDFSDDWDEEETQEKPQILIVEDNQELRNYIALELKNQYEVLEAKDGQEGLEMALEVGPDLIISDVLMPIKDGLEFCSEIKNNIKTSHIPLILLTAKSTVEDQIKGVASGADVYITKPFSIRFLTVQVSQIIESRQKLYSQFNQDVNLVPNKMTNNEIDQAFLQKAIDFIVENIQNPQLGVNSIADLFGLKRMQVYRKIKALTGKSVVNFIRMVRIKEAIKLMDTQKYNLNEIASMTGFNSASYFATSFKEECGKAPSDYLNENVKN